MAADGMAGVDGNNEKGVAVKSMQIALSAMVAISLAAGFAGCRVTGPVNWTMEEAAGSLGLETEYREYRSTFDSPVVQPAPERPKPPGLE